jgi:hypothetical protein
MGFQSSLTVPVNLKYSGKGELMLSAMSAESTHQMMLKLKELTSSVS